MSHREWRYQPREIAYTVILATCYGLLAQIVLHNFSPNGVVSVFWPCSGLALAALVLGGSKYWPGIFAGALIGNYFVGTSLLISVSIAAGNTLEALFAFQILARRGVLNTSLEDAHHFGWICRAGATSACISALIGNSTLLISGFLNWHDIAENLLRWWQGDVLGIVLVTPFILVWRRLPENWFVDFRFFESLALIGLAWLFGQAIFIGWFYPIFGKVAFAYWTFLFVGWGAIRFGRHAVMLIIGIITIQALWGAAHGVGFFGRDLDNAGLLNLWFFLATLTLIGFMLTLTIHARDAAIKSREASEARFRLLASSTFEGIAISENGHIIDANDQLLAMLELPRDRLIGMLVSKLIPEQDQQQVLDNLESGKNADSEHGLIRSDGTQLRVEAHGRPYMHEGRRLRLTALRDVTERIRSHQELIRLNSGLEATLNAIPDLLFELDQEGRYIDVWAQNPELLAEERDLLLGKTVAEKLPAEAANVVMGALEEAEKTGYARGQIIKLNLPVGDRWFELSTSRKRDEDKSASHYIMLSRDITDRKLAEEELRISAIAFESQEGMIVTDKNGVIVRVNKAFSRLTGYSSQEALGRKPSLLQSGKNDRAFYERMWQALTGGGYWQGEIWNRRKDGKIFAEWLTISAVRNSEGSTTHFVGTFSEITQNKEAEAEIHRLAYYDPLTHLPNRRLLHDRVGQALASTNRTGQHGALLFLDLDNFKTLNDTRGHGVGDQLLVEAGRRLQASVREGDTVARLGGDEFVVMIEDLSSDEREAGVKADQIGEKIRTTLAIPYDLDGLEVHCAASIGVALFQGQGESIETLLKHADLAMYKAKNSGRNVLRFFDPEMQTTLDERSALEADLRIALERGQLQLYFQSQVNKSAQIVGAEALLRWVHPIHGLLSPDKFIALAEETGQIISIGLWAWKAACRQVATWSDSPAMQNLRIAVNVSARQFASPDFVEIILRTVAQTGANPNRLKLELTESMVLHDVEDTLRKMLELRAAGIGFSLDDFGTGNSSLAYLTQLPLDQLKIDRSFVLNLPDKRNDAIIAQTILSMAASLGLEAIAEGVETREQLAFLEKHGCNLYQGFYFSRPLPLNKFEEMVKQFSADKIG